MKRRYNLYSIFKQRSKLFLALKPYIGASLAGQVFRDVYDDMALALPKKISRDAFFESSRVLAGTELTREQAIEFAGRIAGNIPTLIAGLPVFVWTKQIANEWVPVQILHVYPDKRGNRPGFSVTCRVLAGSPCPMVFNQFLSKGSCSAIAYIVGFSKNMPYSTALHFANLRLLVELDAARSTDVPHFHQVDCSPSMRTYNKQIIAVRTRALPCPRNFSHPCEHCELGYADCQAAIFPVRLEHKMCPRLFLRAVF